MAPQLKRNPLDGPVGINKRWRKWLVGSTAMVAVVGGAIWFKPYYDLATGPVPEDRCPGHERFVPWEWLDTSLAYSELAIRGCMVEDLLRRVRLVGMDRESVVAFLGKPVSKGHFTATDLVYWLGPEPGWFSIDSQWLVIKLDGSGRVVAASVMTD